MPDANPAANVLREAAQAKRKWTCHKSRFVQFFSMKVPQAPDTTLIRYRALTILNCYGKNPSVWRPHGLGDIELNLISI